MAEFNDNLLYYDFEGWPVYRQNFRTLLTDIGAKTYKLEDGTEVLGFKTNDKLLDLYPITLEDDGMAYGVHEMCFSNADVSKDINDNISAIRFWRDSKNINLLKSQLLHAKTEIEMTLKEDWIKDNYREILKNRIVEINNLIERLEEESKENEKK